MRQVRRVVEFFAAGAGGNCSKSLAGFCMRYLCVRAISRDWRGLKCRGFWADPTRGAKSFLSGVFLRLKSSPQRCFAAKRTSGAFRRRSMPRKQSALSKSMDGNFALALSTRSRLLECQHAPVSQGRFPRSNEVANSCFDRFSGERGTS